MQDAGKERFVTIQVDDPELRTRLLQPGPRAGLTEDGCGQKFVRFLRLLGFLCICGSSLLVALVRACTASAKRRPSTPESMQTPQAPWLLAASEVVAALFVYFLLVPDALFVHKALAQARFCFRRSVEDVVALCVVRGLATSCAYACGSGHLCHRPYLLLSVGCAVLLLPYTATKLALHDYHQRTDAALPEAFLIAMSLGFTALHLLTAMSLRRRAQHRFRMGLLGFGLPWEEGEEAWLMAGPNHPMLCQYQRGPQGSRGSELLGEEGSEDLMLAALEEANSDGDLPPPRLADPDSRFMELSGMLVHYKERAVEGAAAHDAVVLVHGFGGGVFSWRHVMDGLAQSCRCRILAFDRPGFGLTERCKLSRRVRKSVRNPYRYSSQAQMLLALCRRLDVSRVALVGHGDGCVVALLAASYAAKRAQQHGQCARAALPEQEMERGWMLRLAATPPRGLPAELEASSLGGGAASAGEAAATAGGCQAEAGGQADAGLERQRTASASAACSSAAEPGPHTPLGQRRGGDLRPAAFGGRGVDAAVLVRAAREVGAGLEWPCGRPQPRKEQQQAVLEAEVSRLTCFGWSQGLRAADSRSEPPSAWESGAEPAASARAQGSAASAAEISAADARGRRARRERSRSADAAGLALARDAAGPGPSGRTPQVGRDARGSSSPVLVGRIALLHPLPDAESAPERLVHVLGASRLPRHILRPLLHSEVTEVAIRRAWADLARLTPDVLQTYKKPLRVQGWDAALLEAVRVRVDLRKSTFSDCCRALQDTPAFLVTGCQDKLAPIPQVRQLALELPSSLLAYLPGCGHMSHEEAPAALVHLLSPFLSHAPRPALDTDEDLRAPPALLLPASLPPAAGEPATLRS